MDAPPPSAVQVPLPQVAQVPRPVPPAKEEHLPPDADHGVAAPPARPARAARAAHPRPPRDARALAPAGAVLVEEPHAAHLVEEGLGAHKVAAEDERVVQCAQERVLERRPLRPLPPSSSSSSSFLSARAKRVPQRAVSAEGAWARAAQVREDEAGRLALPVAPVRLLEDGRGGRVAEGGAGRGRERRGGRGGMAEEEDVPDRDGVGGVGGEVAVYLEEPDRERGGGSSSCSCSEGERDGEREALRGRVVLERAVEQGFHGERVRGEAPPEGKVGEVARVGLCRLAKADGGDERDVVELEEDPLGVAAAL